MISFRGTVLRSSTLHIRGEYHQRLGTPSLVLRHPLLYSMYRHFYFQGVAQLVARTAGGREVASSSLVTLTITICIQRSPWWLLLFLGCYAILKV